MNMYKTYKAISWLCLAGGIYYNVIGNVQLATYIIVLAFYADWLAEKEK